MHYTFTRLELQYMIKILKIDFLFGVPKKRHFIKKPILNNKLIEKEKENVLRSDIQQLFYYWKNVRYIIYTKPDKHVEQYIMFNMGYIITISVRKKKYELDFERYTEPKIYKKLIEIMNIDPVTSCSNEFRIQLSDDGIKLFERNNREFMSQLSETCNIPLDVLDSFKNTMKKRYAIHFTCYDFVKNHNMKIIKATGSSGVYMIKTGTNGNWIVNATSSNAARELYTF